MKRQSKAEEALTREIKKINTNIEALRFRIRDLQVELEAIDSIRVQLEITRSNLETARKESSIRNKPKA